jgi:NAD(P)-dependent dehydrogenase (short-subunit alcohol dehydrogenase family)
MSEWLFNKRLVIIGGTAGMGLSAAMACIKEGARVVAVGKNPEHVEEAARQFKNDGIAITGDATEEITAEKAIQTCVENFGGFDGSLTEATLLVPGVLTKGPSSVGI